MAIRDHTVRIRSSVPSDDTLTPPPRDHSSRSATWPETPRRSTRGHIALAVLALTHPITPKIAIRLSLTFDTTAFYWLALQARYDLEREKPVVRAYRPLVD